MFMRVGEIEFIARTDFVAHFVADSCPLASEHRPPRCALLDRRHPAAPLSSAPKCRAQPQDSHWPDASAASKYAGSRASRRPGSPKAPLSDVGNDCGRSPNSTAHPFAHAESTSPPLLTSASV